MDAGDFFPKGFTFESRGTRLIDHRVAHLLGRQVVEMLSAVDLSVQLRHICEIVQGKGIVGIIKVGLIEKGIRFFKLMFAHRFDALPIQALHRSRLASFRKCDFQVVGAR